MNGKHIEAVEQVLPERAGLEQTLQVSVGGGKDAYVGLDSVVAADALESPVL